MFVNSDQIAKYRGYSKDVHRWVTGSFWAFDDTTFAFLSDYPKDKKFADHNSIVVDAMTDWGLPNRQIRYDVVPESVGQYTGIHDTKHKSIYAGDICKGGWIIQWRPGGFWYVSPSEHKEFYLTPDSEGTLEVIGNLFETPELLEENDE